MQSVLEILKKTADFLEAKGVPKGRQEAEYILAHSLGIRRLDLYLQHDRPLSELELAAVRPLVRRRAAREPLQHLLGGIEFGDLQLRVDARALIPRPETEEMLDRLPALLDSPPLRILDLGTGSGAIALSLARQFPAAVVVATDVSPDALALARENAALNQLEARVSWRESDWFSAVDGTYDLIVSNPPYLSDAEVEEADPEVREYEPAIALRGGPHGMDALSIIVREALRFLSPGGLLALETGLDQHAELHRLSAATGYQKSHSLQDLTRRPRFFLAWR